MTIEIDPDTGLPNINGICFHRGRSLAISEAYLRNRYDRRPADGINSRAIFPIINLMR